MQYLSTEELRRQETIRKAQIAGMFVQSDIPQPTAILIDNGVVRMEYPTIVINKALAATFTSTTDIVKGGVGSGRKYYIRDGKRLTEEQMYAKIKADTESVRAQPTVDNWTARDKEIVEEKKNKTEKGFSPNEDVVGQISKAKSTPEQQAKMKKVMEEYKSGKLKSSSGDAVSKRKQAIAIAMSEAGLSKGYKKEVKGIFSKSEYSQPMMEQNNNGNS